MGAAVEKRRIDTGWAKEEEWKVPEKGHLVRRSKIAASGWETNVFLRFVHLYLSPCLSIFVYISMLKGMLQRSLDFVVKFSKNKQTITIDISRERNAILSGFGKPDKIGSEVVHCCTKSLG